MISRILYTSLLASLLLGVFTAHAQIAGHTRFGAAPFALPFQLQDSAAFGRSMAVIGDLDGNGTPDLAVGSRYLENGSWRNAIHVLYLRENNGIDSAHTIDHTDTIAGGLFDASSGMGEALATIGDINNDGIPDLLVGAPTSDIEGQEAGAVHILLLRRNGTVLDTKSIHRQTPGFSSAPSIAARFGFAVCAMPDLNFDGRPELLVGAPFEPNGGTERGAVFLITLNESLDISSTHRYLPGSGVLSGVTSDDHSHFGSSLVPVGDVNGNGFMDAAISMPGMGAAGGVVLLHYKTGLALQGYSVLDPPESATGIVSFGRSLAALGCADGLCDLVIGCALDSTHAGRLLYARIDSQGIAEYELFGNDTLANTYHLPFENNDAFGSALAASHVLDGNGTRDLWVGSPFGTTQGLMTGALWRISSQPRPALRLILSEVSTPTTEGGKNGAITLIPRGFAGEDYTLSWSNNETTHQLTKLGTGTYHCTLKRTGKPDLHKQFSMGYEVHWRTGANSGLQLKNLAHQKTHAHQLNATATNRFTEGTELWAEYTVPLDPGEGHRYFGFTASSAASGPEAIQQGFYLHAAGM